MSGMNITLHGIPMWVEFFSYKGNNGTRDSFGVPLTPPDPPEMELVKVEVGGVDIYPLIGESVCREIEDEISNHEPEVEAA